jgi:phage portal protein BeeE
MTWLDAITFDTVIVHTLNDGPSLRGLKLAVYDDGILLGEVVNLDNEPLVVEAGAIYRSQPIIAGVVDKLARRIATLPFDPYRSLTTAAARPASSRDSLDTLASPAVAAAGTVHLLAHVFQSLLMHGNALVAKLRGPDREAAADHAVAAGLGAGRRVRRAGRPISSGGRRPSSARSGSSRDRGHAAFRVAGPTAAEIGVSPLEKLGVTIRLEDAAQRFQTAHFRNGNRPSLAISRSSSRRGRARSCSSDPREHRGLHKGARPCRQDDPLGADAKVQPLSLSPVEAALIEQRKLNREEVGMVYDLGGPLMSTSRTARLGNVAELRALYRDVLPPWTS